MWQRCGVCNNDIILAVDNHSLDNSLSCSIALVEHLIRKAKRPLLFRFRRTVQAPFSSPTLSDEQHFQSTSVSKTKENELEQIRYSNIKPRVSLNVTVNIGEVSILLLHDHKLFVFVELRDVATLCQSKAIGNELVASISIHKVFVLDLTPQGTKHRDVLRPADSITGPMISIEFKSTDVSTDLKVQSFFPHLPVVVFFMYIVIIINFLRY